MSKHIFTRKEGLNTLVDVLESINCNFEAEQVPIYQVPNTDDRMEIPGYSCIRRGDDKTPLGVMSARYGLSQYRDQLVFLEDMKNQGEIDFYGAVATDKGASLYVAVKTPKSVFFGPGDEIECFFISKSSHDGSGAIELMCSPVHTKTQTILTTLDSGIIRMRHSKNIKDRLSRVMGTISKMNAVWEAHIDKFNRFAKLSMSDDEAKTYFAMIVPSDEIGDDVPTRITNVREKLYDIYKVGVVSNIPSCRGTLLGGFVAALVFGDYYKATRTSCIGRSEHDILVESRLSGAGARFKADSFAAALKLYKIHS